MSKVSQNKAKSRSVLSTRVIGVVIIVLIIILLAAYWFRNQSTSPNAVRSQICSQNPIYCNATVITTSSNSSITQTNSQISNCPTTVNVGTSGSGSTGGNCSNFMVTIGTYGTYQNYGNACPSVVNIGTYGTYYNNVTGCNPQVNVGTGAKYYNNN